MTLSVNPQNSATLLMTSTATGSETDYDYTVQTTAYNSQYFSQPSFVNPAITGTLQGGGDNSTTPSVVYSYGLTFQPNGNLYTYAEPASGVSGYTNFIMGTWGYSYDNLNRLAGATINQQGNPNTNYCWSYDAFGNRTNQEGSTAAFESGSGGPNVCTPQPSASVTPDWSNYSAANNNQVAATSKGTFQYDSAGDVTFDGANTYVYDADGHICAVTIPQYDAPPLMIGYVYDADGNRVAKGTITNTNSCDPSLNGFTATASYVLDQSGNQLTEVDAEANGITPWHTNVYANGSLMATYDNNGLHFQLNDWLGTRRVQTNYASVTELSFQSLPFGDSLTSIPNPACLPANQCYAKDPTGGIHFTGKERDSESGNDYFGARYYASSMGRMMSPDPGNVGVKPENPQSWNLYSYSLNNPLSFT